MTQYTRINWVNNSAPALNADNLNRMDIAILGLTQDVDTLNRRLSSIATNDTITALNNTVNTLENEVTTVKTNVNGLSTRVTNVESNLNNASTRITNVEISKQDILQSGTTIKTINGQSLLGAGNITISGGNGTGGADGVSPTIEVSTITGGHKLTITDVNGTENINVMDGTNGRDGNDGASAGFGDPQATIDDTTGTPSVEVIASGSNTAKIFTFNFSGLKGEKGEKGADGTSVMVKPGQDDCTQVGDAYIDDNGHLQILLDTKTKEYKDAGKIQGDSAYEIWLAAGNSGDEETFLTSLKGADGNPGAPGGQGPQGDPGTDGKDGVGIYMLVKDIGSATSIPIQSIRTPTERSIQVNDLLLSPASFNLFQVTKVLASTVLIEDIGSLKGTNGSSGSDGSNGFGIYTLTKEYTETEKNCNASDIENHTDRELQNGDLLMTPNGLLFQITDIEDEPDNPVIQYVSSLNITPSLTWGTF